MNDNYKNLFYKGKSYPSHTIVNMMNLNNIFETDECINQAEYIKTKYDVSKGQLYYFRILDNNSLPKMIVISEDEVERYISSIDSTPIDEGYLDLISQEKVHESVEEEMNDDTQKKSMHTIGKCVLVISIILAAVVGVVALLISVPGLIQIIGCLIILALAGVFLLGSEVVGTIIVFLIAAAIVFFLFSDAGRPFLIIIGVVILALFIRAIWKN